MTPTVTCVLPNSPEQETSSPALISRPVLFLALLPSFIGPHLLPTISYFLEVLSSKIYVFVSLSNFPINRIFTLVPLHETVSPIFILGSFAGVTNLQSAALAVFLVSLSVSLPLESAGPEALISVELNKPEAYAQSPALNPPTPPAVHVAISYFLNLSSNA